MSAKNPFSGWLVAFMTITMATFHPAVMSMSRAASDLNGEWTYLGAGRATIVQDGNRIRMRATWTASSVPGPHYEIDATLSGNLISGVWRHLSADTGAERLRKRYFEARLGTDGESIAVSNTEDNEGHNWNSVVLTRVPGASTTPDLTAVDIIAPDSDEPINQIAIGDSFRVRLTFAEEPDSEITETVTIGTPGGASQEVRVTGNSRVIVSGPVTVAPAGQ